MNNIVSAVAISFDLTDEDLKNGHRDARTALARHIVYYLAWQHTGLTLKEIGQALGGRTPATISHGYQRIARLRLQRPKLEARIQLLKEALCLK